MPPGGRLIQDGAGEKAHTAKDEEDQEELALSLEVLRRAEVAVADAGVQCE